MGLRLSLFLIIVCAVVCFFLVFLAVPRVSAICSKPPPTGLWLIQTYEPTIDFLHPFVSGYLYLRRDKKNPEVFIGPASVTPGITPTFFGFSLTAVFDEETCTLYGAYMLSPAMVHDTITWKYDGNNLMYGLYNSLIWGKTQFSQNCMHILQYQGPEKNFKKNKYVSLRELQ